MSAEEIGNSPAPQLQASASTQLELLHRISGIVSSSLTLQKMLDDLVGLVVSVTGCDACLVYLVDELAGEIVLCASQLPHLPEIGECTKISKNGEDVYQYLNHQKAGNWIGFPIRDANTLSITCQKSDGRNLGVSVYKIEKGDKGPTLTGFWAPYPGGGMVKDSLKWSRRVD
jgi:hypothetical protein